MQRPPRQTAAEAVQLRCWLAWPAMQERAAHALALSDLAGRKQAAAKLALALHHQIALQLLHMNREETEANRVLWSGLDDAALLAISKQTAAQIAPSRALEWQRLVQNVVTPVDLALVARAPVG